jgi:PAS domain S-box-containing protein
MDQQRFQWHSGFMAAGSSHGGRFHLAMLHSPIGMAVVGTGGELLEFNDALCQMLDRTAEQLVAVRWQDVTHPDDLDSDAALVQQVLDGKRDSYRLHKRYVRPDGSVVHGELAVVAMRRADGTVDAFISQIVDISEVVRLQNQYRLVAENVSDVVSVGDNEGRVRWVSPSVTAATGWSPQELVGTPFRDLVHPEDQTAVRNVQDALLEGMAQQLEVRLRTKAEGYRWMSIRIRPHIDESGTVVGRIAAWWDAEALRQATEHARSAEARYRAAMDAQLDAQLFLDAVRLDGRIVDFVFVDANPAAARYMRMPVGAMIGQRLLELFPGHHDSGLFALYVGVVDSGEPAVLEGSALVSEVQEADRFFDLHAVKVEDGLSVVWRDVTDRVQAADTLADSERRFRLLADNSADTVLLASGGIMRWLSPSLETLLGYKPDDWIGRRFEEFTHPDDVALAQARRAEISAGERRYTRLRMRHHDGHYCWIDINAGPVADLQGGLAGIVATLRSADELVSFEHALADSEAQALNLAAKYERARDEAVLANQAKTKFLSRMSHELRTPLNAILGFAQLLSMDALSADQREAVGQIRAGGRHLLDLINEILDISRIEAGRLALSIEPVHSADVIAEAVDLMQALAEASGTRLSVDDQDGWLLGDRQRLIQILINLISNAIKYGGPDVRVHCEPSRISVIDNGPGISQQDQPVIFEPFERLHADALGIEGTGIGLALSLGLVQAMHGEIVLDSAPGAGSTFTVILPQAPAPLAEAEEVSAIPDSGSGSGRRVLYVEDNPANALLMRRISARRSAVILDVAGTGREGISVALSQRPDLVLVDLHLPDMPGEEVLRTIRQELPEAQIVVVTADATATARVRAEAAGADGFLAKPLNVADVLALLDG